MAEMEMRVAHDMSRRSTPVLFVDLDGTIRKGFDELGRFVNVAADVELFPGVAAKLKAYADHGWRIVGVTNQGGIALGHLTLADARAAVVETQRQAGGVFDRIFMCQHHPQAHDPERSNCFCRKPKMGMLVMAQTDMSAQHFERYPPHRMLMVGDRSEDEQCARSAGVAFKWAKDWREEPFL